METPDAHLANQIFIPKLKIDNNFLQLPEDSPSKQIQIPIPAEPTPPTRKRFYSFSITSLPTSPNNASTMSDSPRTTKSIKLCPALSRFSKLSPRHGDENASGRESFASVRPNEDPDEKARRILASPKRTQDDALFIYKLIQHYDFFNKFKENNIDLYEIDSLLHICRHLGYEKFKRGQTVFEEGDESNGKMYLVFSGEASIIVKNLDFVTKQNMVDQHIADEPVTVESDSESDDSADSIKSIESGLLPNPPAQQQLQQSEVGGGFSELFRRKKDSKEVQRLTSFRLSHSNNNIGSINNALQKPPEATRNTRLWKKFLTVSKFTKAGRPKSILVDPRLIIKEPEVRNIQTPSTGEIKRRASRMIPIGSDSIRHILTPANLQPMMDSGFKEERDSMFKMAVNREMPKSSFRTFGNSLLKRKDSDHNMSQSLTIPAVRHSAMPSAVPLEDMLKSKYGSIVMKISKGGFFGEKALHSQKKRSATIVTNEDCEFLTISEELFSYIKARFEKTNTKKLNFLLDNFPDMETIKNRTILENLLYLLEEKPFDLHANLTAEGTKGKHFYILYEGVCNVYRKLPDDDPEITKLRKYGDQEGINKDGLLVCQIFPGAFIGEEVVFNGINQYEFTVKAASSSVTAMAVDRANFSVRFPSHVYKALKALHKSKCEHYLNIVAERAKLKSDIVHLARPMRKKKVGLYPGETSTSDYIQSLNLSRTYFATEEDERITKEEFSRRAIVRSKFTHLGYQSMRSKDDFSHTGRRFDTKASDVLMTEGSNVMMQTTMRSFKQAATETRFDFGADQDGMGRDDGKGPRKAPVPKFKVPKHLNMVQLHKDPETAVPHEKRVNSIEYDVLGSQLLYRVKKSRNRSRKYPRDATFQSMSHREPRVAENYIASIELAGAPSLTRLQNEPFVPYSQQLVGQKFQIDTNKKSSIGAINTQEPNVNDQLGQSGPLKGFAFESPAMSHRKHAETSTSLNSLATTKRTLFGKTGTNFKKSEPEAKVLRPDIEPFQSKVAVGRSTPSNLKTPAKSNLPSLPTFKLATKTPSSRGFASPRQVSLEAGFLSGMDPVKLNKLDGQNKGISMSARGAKPLY